MISRISGRHVTNSGFDIKCFRVFAVAVALTISEKHILSVDSTRGYYYSRPEFFGDSSYQTDYSDEDYFSYTGENVGLAILGAPGLRYPVYPTANIEFSFTRPSYNERQISFNVKKIRVPSPGIIDILKYIYGQGREAHPFLLKATDHESAIDSRTPGIGLYAPSVPGNTRTREKDQILCKKGTGGTKEHSPHQETSFTVDQIDSVQRKADNSPVSEIITGTHQVINSGNINPTNLPATNDTHTHETDPGKIIQLPNAENSGHNGTLNSEFRNRNETSYIHAENREQPPYFEMRNRYETSRTEHPVADRAPYSGVENSDQIRFSTTSEANQTRNVQINDNNDSEFHHSTIRHTLIPPKISTTRKPFSLKTTDGKGGAISQSSVTNENTTTLPVEFIHQKVNNETTQLNSSTSQIITKNEEESTTNENVSKDEIILECTTLFAENVFVHSKTEENTTPKPVTIKSTHQDAETSNSNLNTDYTWNSTTISLSEVFGNTQPPAYSDIDKAFTITSAPYFLEITSLVSTNSAADSLMEATTTSGNQKEVNDNIRDDNNLSTSTPKPIPLKETSTTESYTETDIGENSETTTSRNGMERGKPWGITTKSGLDANTFPSIKEFTTSKSIPPTNEEFVTDTSETTTEALADIDNIQNKETTELPTLLSIVTTDKTDGTNAESTTTSPGNGVENTNSDEDITTKLSNLQTEKTIDEATTKTSSHNRNKLENTTISPFGNFESKNIDDKVPTKEENNSEGENDNKRLNEMDDQNQSQSNRLINGKNEQDVTTRVTTSATRFHWFTTMSTLTATSNSNGNGKDLNEREYSSTQKENILTNGSDTKSQDENKNDTWGHGVVAHKRPDNLPNTKNDTSKTQMEKSDETNKATSTIPKTSLEALSASPPKARTPHVNAFFIFIQQDHLMKNSNFEFNKNSSKVCGKSGKTIEFPFSRDNNSCYLNYTECGPKKQEASEVVYNTTCLLMLLDTGKKPAKVMIPQWTNQYILSIAGNHNGSFAVLIKMGVNILLKVKIEEVRHGGDLARVLLSSSIRFKGQRYLTEEVHPVRFKSRGLFTMIIISDESGYTIIWNNEWKLPLKFNQSLKEDDKYRRIKIDGSITCSMITYELYNT